MKCLHCHMTIPNGATTCPYCHNKTYIENKEDRRTFAKWLFIISGGFAAVGGVLLVIKPFHNRFYPEQIDNTVAYIVIGMAGLMIAGTIIGLICSWIEEKLGN